MAGKKKNDQGGKAAADAPETGASDTGTPETSAPEAEAVVVGAPGARGPEPETVDAEIVDDDPAVAADTSGGAGPTSETVRADDTQDEARNGKSESGKTKNGKTKGGKGGFIVGLLVLAAVGAALFYLFRDDILGTREARVAETTPGMVVSDAAPLPGSDRDGDPIVGEAAPGARDAAVAADAARDAAEGEGTTSALRARAAERNRARREAMSGDAQAPSGFVSEDGESDMAAAVREARAAQVRIRREDAAADAVGAAGAVGIAGAVSDRADEDGNAGEDADQEAEADDRAARLAALRARRDAPQDADEADEAEADADQPSDDPNALSGFSGDAGSTDDTVDAANVDDADNDAGTLRDRMAERFEDDGVPAQTADGARADTRSVPSAPTSPARPTGRITPLGGQPDDADEADAGADADRNDQARATLTRPAVRRDTRGALPSNAVTDGEFEDRLDAVEAELRDALRQDLTAEVRADVLAEASQRIDDAISQTEAEVAQLRTQLGAQEQRSDQRIAQLTDRLEVLQDRDATANTRGVLILALSNLRGQVDAGAPFERQLDDVERVAPNVTSLRDARRFAREGLPTDADLRERFREAEREALRREAGQGADGFLGGIWANIKGLFTVRDIGETEGEDTAAVISRARAAMARGEVGVAVQQVDQLDGVAAEAFAPFIEEARAKAGTMLQIQRLERAVLAQPSERG